MELERVPGGIQRGCLNDLNSYRLSLFEKKKRRSFLLMFGITIIAWIGIVFTTIWATQFSGGAPTLVTLIEQCVAVVSVVFFIWKQRNYEDSNLASLFG